MNRRFRNAYYALRHGTSEANERGIIVSHPEHGTTGWGLSVAGAADCRSSLSPERLREPKLTIERTLVVSSDFTRATETAAILCELHGLRPFAIDVGLRERHFGDLEREPTNRYGEVWEHDMSGADQGHAGAESTESVAARMLGVIERLERENDDTAIILVSHGDPLQILETVLADLPSHRHRERPHLGNAELRRLQGRVR